MMHRLTATAVALAFPALASAVPVDLLLDPAGPGANRADFSVSTPAIPVTLSDASDASGTIAAEVDFAGTLPTTFSFDAAGTDVAFTDVTLSVAIFGTVAQTSNVSGTISGGPFAVAPDGTFDVGGAVLTLDEGFVGFLGDDPSNNDLSGNPIVLTIPAGNSATLASTDLGGGLVDLVLEAPINFSGQVDDDPVINLTVAGTLVSRGTAIIPEPASLAFGVVGLLALRRRR